MIDISVRHSGYMQCEPGYRCGPKVCECFLFHLVLSGAGMYVENGRRHPVQQGQGFLIWPGKTIQYDADAHNPWSYAWIGFHGTDALRIIRGMGLSEEQLIWKEAPDEQLINYCKRILRDVPHCPDALSLDATMAGDMLSFLAYAGCHRDAASTQSMMYCKKALWYMHTNLSAEVTVESISTFVGLSRSQLFRTFKEAYGKSPREVLALIRVEQAQYMLHSTAFTLEQIALACGYANESHFCVAFKRGCGFSPTEYRKKQTKFSVAE